LKPINFFIREIDNINSFIHLHFTPYASQIHAVAFSFELIIYPMNSEDQRNQRNPINPTDPINSINPINQ
jgi:hypothetical protein